MKIESLKWDSDFFGYPVGIMNLGALDMDEQQLLADSKMFKLVYVTGLNPQKSSLLSHGDSKKVFGKPPVDHGTDAWVAEMPNEKMAEAVRIGLQSGLWSRFALDKRFCNNEFERLYRTWVERSVTQEIAYKTLTVLVGGEPTGIITLSRNGDHESSIGLFSVDSEHRGQGIGKSLLKAADTLSCKRGDSQLTVATQGKNIAACEVYQRFGFELISETYIYNYWNEAFTVQ